MVAAAMLDSDSRAVVDALRAAVVTSALPQYAFARATGTSPSRLSAYLHGATAPSAVYLVRAQRIAAALAGARDEGIPTVIDAAAAINGALHAGLRPSAVLRLVLESRDRLRDTLAHRPHLADAWDARATVEHPAWDALFAALSEHEFVEAGRPAPPWSRRVPLDSEWMPTPGRRSREEVQLSTPSWLREKRILIAADDLLTA